MSVSRGRIQKPTLSGRHRQRLGRFRDSAQFGRFRLPNFGQSSVLSAGAATAPGRAGPPRALAPPGPAEKRGRPRLPPTPPAPLPTDPLCLRNKQGIDFRTLERGCVSLDGARSRPAAWLGEAPPPLGGGICGNVRDAVALPMRQRDAPGRRLYDVEMGRCPPRRGQPVEVASGSVESVPTTAESQEVARIGQN